MSIVLEKNLDILKEYHPNVFNKLKSYLNGEYTKKENSIEKILVARKDNRVINMLIVSPNKEYLICDPENPVSQAYSWVDKYINASIKTDIIFGMGFGFHIEVLLASFDKRVLIVEPDIELFYQILCIRNLEKILKGCELFVEEDTNSVLKRLNEFLWDNTSIGIECEPFEVYEQMFKKQWDELSSKIIKQAQSFSVDFSTRKYLGELWIHNNIKNAEIMYKASNSEGLVNSFRNIPGVLVSAGPSLEKNVHLLKGIEDKCVIIAAGTAVRILEEKGIEPHFMVGIDAGEGEARIHKNVKSKDIYFIYSNQVATGSVEGYSGPKFFMNYTADIYTAQFLMSAGIESELFLSGPSVANTCFDILHKMGCNPIILIGQDLAYTQEKLYAGRESEKLNIDSTNYEKQGYIIEKDIFGNAVYTRSAYISMRNWFEGIFEKTANSVEIINATEGGLNIQYSRNDTLANVLQNYISVDHNVKNLIKKIFEENTFDQNIGNMLQEYKETVKTEIADLEKSSKEQMKLVELIRRGVYSPKKDKKAYDKVASRITNLSDLVLKSKIYYPILRNLIEIEFFLISREVNLSTSEKMNYEAVKDIYVNAAKEQNKILVEKLNKIKEFLKEQQVAPN